MMRLLLYIATRVRLIELRLGLGLLACKAFQNRWCLRPGLADFLYRSVSVAATLHHCAMDKTTNRHGCASISLGFCTMKFEFQIMFMCHKMLFFF